MYINPVSVFFPLTALDDSTKEVQNFVNKMFRIFDYIRTPLFYLYNTLKAYNWTWRGAWGNDDDAIFISSEKLLIIPWQFVKKLYDLR